MKTSNSKSNIAISLSVPKEPPGNEDAQESAPKFGLIAISDGVSNGSTLTSYWSNLLVKSFCESRVSKPCEYIRDRHRDWLHPLQLDWQQAYENMLRNIQQNKSPNTWNPSATPQAQRNAKGGATFLGVHLLPLDLHGQGKWQAIAIGDSCVFQFRKSEDGKNELCNFFPLEKSTDFSDKTGGFSSRADNSLVGEMKFKEFDYQLGDIFLLATDALAQWIIKKIEDGKNDWQWILDIEDKIEFEEKIKDLREKDEIVYDDTTFCRIQVISSPLERQGSVTTLAVPQTFPLFAVPNLVVACNGLCKVTSLTRGISVTTPIDSDFSTNSTSNKIASSKTAGSRTPRFPSWVEHLILIITLSIVVITLLYFPYQEVSSKLDEISRALSKLSNKGTQTPQAYNLVLPSNDTKDERKRVTVKQIVNGRLYINNLFLNEKHQDIFNYESKVCFWVEIPDKYFRSGSRGIIAVYDTLRIWRCNGPDKPSFEDTAGDLLPGIYLVKGDRSFSVPVPYNAQFRTVEFYLVSSD